MWRPWSDFMDMLRHLINCGVIIIIIISGNAIEAKHAACLCRWCSVGVWLWSEVLCSWTKRVTGGNHQVVSHRCSWLQTTWVANYQIIVSYKLFITGLLPRTVLVVNVSVLRAHRPGIRCQTVFAIQRWVSTFLGVNWRRTFLQNIDEMYLAH